MLISLSVTSRGLISLQNEAVLSPCNFATTHSTACILNFYPLKLRDPWNGGPFCNAPFSTENSLGVWLSILAWKLQSRREILNSLRAKGTLISEPRFATPCEMRFFPREKGKTAFSNKKPSTKAIFPFLRGKNRISQGVENRGSLISVPLALRVFFNLWPSAVLLPTILCKIITRMNFLFRDCSYSFQGSSELNSITVSVSLFSSKTQLREIIPLRSSQEFSASTVTWFNGFQILNVMVSLRSFSLIFRFSAQPTAIYTVQRCPQYC